VDCNCKIKKHKILCVEDNFENKVLLRRVLEAEGYNVIEASNGMEGFKLARQEEPDLILMDLGLPMMNGHEAATKIKGTKGLENVVVIALSGQVMKGDRERSLIAGCDGYIPTPIDVDRLPRQLEEFLHGKRERINSMEEREYLQEYTRLLVDRLEERIGISLTDELTGICNRRGFNLRLDEELSRAGRYNFGLALIMIDIDDFKQVNDHYGHLAGDLVLRELAQLFRVEKRKHELLSRYGGEEFIIILAEEDGPGAFVVAERLREKVQDHIFISYGHPIKITVSSGISYFLPNEPLGREYLICRADEALYKAKKGGKNRSVLL